MQRVMAAVKTVLSVMSFADGLLPSILLYYTLCARIGQDAKVEMLRVVRVKGDGRCMFRALALGVAGVRALDKCRVRKSGLSHLVDIQVRVDGALTVREGHDIAHAVKDALLASPLRVSDVSVHIEPAG